LPPTGALTARVQRPQLAEYLKRILSLCPYRISILRIGSGGVTHPPHLQSPKIVYYNRRDYYRIIKESEFLSRLASVVFENAGSMLEFRRFLDRPGVEKIVVGNFRHKAQALSTHSQHFEKR